MVAMAAMAAIAPRCDLTAMAAASSQPALLYRHSSSPSLLSSRVALSPSKLNLNFSSDVEKRIGGIATTTCSAGSSRGLSVVAMAKKGKKGGGGGGSVVQKERSTSSDGGAKESAYANETRKIILSVHKLQKVCARAQLDF